MELNFSNLVVDYNMELVFRKLRELEFVFFIIYRNYTLLFIFELSSYLKLFLPLEKCLFNWHSM